MPTPPRSRGSLTRTQGLLLTGGLAVLTAGLLLAFVLRLSQHSGAKLRLGDDVFSVGRPDRYAPPIAKNGPLIFQDLLNRRRDVFLQHLGTDDQKGWLAFEAHAPGAPRRCQLRWERANRTFTDPCSGASYPDDGGTLPHFPVAVTSTSIRIDLRPQPAP